jgi:hypothetical protein
VKRAWSDCNGFSEKRDDGDNALQIGQQEACSNGDIDGCIRRGEVTVRSLLSAARRKNERIDG